jgi:hypothetical protein
LEKRCIKERKRNPVFLCGCAESRKLTKWKLKTVQGKELRPVTIAFLPLSLQNQCRYVQTSKLVDDDDDDDDNYYWWDIAEWPEWCVHAEGCWIEPPQWQ